MRPKNKESECSSCGKFSKVIKGMCDRCYGRWYYYRSKKNGFERKIKLDDGKIGGDDMETIRRLLVKWKRDWLSTFDYMVIIHLYLKGGGKFRGLGETKNPNDDVGDMMQKLEKLFVNRV